MEVEGEILGLVIIFLVISAGFYFFIIADNGDDGSTTPPPPAKNISSGGANQTQGNLTGGNGAQESGTISNVSFEDIEELHWNHMPLTYRFVNNESNCSGAPIIEMKKAFDIIVKASSYKVNFTEVGENQTADINITCVDRLELLK